MASSWIKSLALPVLLLTLLAACQQRPYSRDYTRTSAYTSSYGGSYGACARHPCASAPQSCPPGYVLARIPYSLGGPGRYCRPYSSRWSRCCSSPTPPRGPICGGYGRSCY